ncbi:hypothetical protein BD779DRAFT_1025356 [Infundibulicybe gibba]|nr:hypothetical protein BD779DRAFT_1025356 [Infundibulicybe gibba]
MIYVMSPTKNPFSSHPRTGGSPISPLYIAIISSSTVFQCQYPMFGCLTGLNSLVVNCSGSLQLPKLLIRGCKECSQLAWKPRVAQDVGEWLQLVEAPINHSKYLNHSGHLPKIAPGAHTPTRKLKLPVIARGARKRPELFRVLSELLKLHLQTRGGNRRIFATHITVHGLVDGRYGYGVVPGYGVRSLLRLKFVTCPRLMSPAVRS